jgi:hypothetical protein
MTTLLTPYDTSSSTTNTSPELPAGGIENKNPAINCGAKCFRAHKKNRAEVRRERKSEISSALLNAY